jgi:fused signal recognition particle receptor
MFKKLSLFGLVLAVVVISLGGYLNLKHQGLGCEDWPACYGKEILAGANSNQPAWGPESGVLQQIHLYLASALGLWGLILAGFAFSLSQQKWSTIAKCLWLLVLIAAQAWVGQKTLGAVYQPILLTVHHFLGLLTVWSLACLYVSSLPRVDKPRSWSFLNVLVWLAQAVLVLEIVLGSWVANNLGGLACPDFPRCNGVYLPEGDYVGALNLIQAWFSEHVVILDDLSRSMLMSLHYVLSLLVFLILNWAMFKATDETQPRGVRRAGSILALMLLCEILFGVLAVKHALPLSLTLAHSVWAGLLMLPLIVIARLSRYGVLPSDLAETAQAIPLVRPVSEVSVQPQNLYQRLSSQLSRTRGALGGLLTGQTGATDLIEQIETSLLMADMGIETTQTIIQHLTQTLDKQQLADPQMLIPVLKQHLYEILQPCSQALVIPKQDKPYVILVVGVNGAGKTTSIGKLAHRLQAQGHSVMLAAGDTFRAAAVEQLQTWGERNHVQVVAQHTGADSASVIFDALQSAQAKGVDVLIADTAGRLHTKSNLMDELKKIKRIMSKLDESAPHEVLLILDAGTGQNALSQARQFDEAVQLTGLALTKLDGTAKGGIIFALAQQLKRPIRFIGVGEAMTDLQDFDARSFVDALFETQ